MLEDFEGHLAEIPSGVWLACGLIPLLAVIFIVADFPWFIAIPPALASMLFFALFVWAWRVRRRRS